MANFFQLPDECWSEEGLGLGLGLGSKLGLGLGLGSGLGYLLTTYLVGVRKEYGSKSAGRVSKVREW
eukprot:scaffold25479_cov42-Phaeocystis_antarctica.AAC.1